MTRKPFSKIGAICYLKKKKKTRKSSETKKNVTVSILKIK